MASARCPFCKQKLDPDGYCQNAQCVDYKRTEIEKKEKPADENDEKSTDQ